MKYSISILNLLITVERSVIQESRNILWTHYVGETYLGSIEYCLNDVGKCGYYEMQSAIDHSIKQYDLYHDACTALAYIYREKFAISE